jgi:hypothetical protein
MDETAMGSGGFSCNALRVIDRILLQVA